MVLKRGFKTWCENAAKGFRRELALDPLGPLDPVVLARHLKIQVWVPGDILSLGQANLDCLTVTEKDCWSALTIRDGNESLVILNSGHAPVRRNNSLAHELSHVILRHDPPRMIPSADGGMIMTDYDPGQEEEAGTLGGALLVPRDALMRLIDTGMPEQEMADFFAVSTALIRERKNKTGIGLQLARRGTWRP